MENWWTSYRNLLGVILGLILLQSCDRLSNETYAHLDANERRKISNEYLALAKTLSLGSPEAMRTLEKAARINPKNELVWQELSWPYLYNGLYKQWNEYMEKAIEINPKEWQGNRGYVKLTYLKDYGGALYDFEAHDTIKTDISHEGRLYSTHYLKGLCYLGLKNYDEAEKSFDQYLITESQKTGTYEIDATAYVYLGLIHIDKQQYKKALTYLNKGLEEQNPLADAYYHAAYAQFMLGEAQLAYEYITESKKLFEAKQYNKQRLNTVLFQLYERDLENLEAEINCFL